jgi:hypothetical protein
VLAFGKISNTSLHAPHNSRVRKMTTKYPRYTFFPTKLPIAYQIRSSLPVVDLSITMPALFKVSHKNEWDFCDQVLISEFLGQLAFHLLSPHLNLCLRRTKLWFAREHSIMPVRLFILDNLRIEFFEIHVFSVVST